MLPISNLVVFALMALLAGASFVMQQAVNADLSATLGSAAWAGFVSYLGGTLCMLALAAVTSAGIPTLATVSGSTWIAWSGGIFGAAYIAISIFLVPRIGTATFVALLVAGQMLSSLVFDNYGLLGVPQHAITVPRLLGVLLLIGAVTLIRM